MCSAVEVKSLSMHCVDDLLVLKCNISVLNVSISSTDLSYL